MKLATLARSTAALMVVALSVFAVVVVFSGSAVAQENEEGNNEGDSATYSYVAQPGDAYSLIARKAVQTYGLLNNVDLSPAGIIYAETQLTLAANSPELNVGQEVTLEESTVKEWAEKAENLNEADEAAWAAYAEGVDFNTDHVGEARN